MTTVTPTGSWRVAKCLDQLLAEINAAAPNRSKVSDGSIGDEDHQSRNSDHNPWCCGWVVTARDFTHDPANGFDSYAYADWQRQRCRGDILVDGQRETRVKYIISNRRIASPDENWAWRQYTGDNPHDHHCHVSVDCTGEGGYMDDTTPWGWGGDDMQLSDQVSGTEGRTVDICISDVWNAIAAGRSGFDETAYLFINAQLNDMQQQINATAGQTAAILAKLEELGSAAGLAPDGSHSHGPAHTH